MTAIRLRLTETQYHADPCDRPSLSNSIAKILLDASPLHAWQAHPRYGGTPHAPSAVFDRGSLIHRLLLGAGPTVDVIAADDWRAKDARDARDLARSAGHIPVLSSDYDDAIIATAAIRVRLADEGVHLSGESEIQIAWEERVGISADTTWCRGMLDHAEIADGRATIYDLKTTRTAHPHACAKHVVAYGYDTQRAAYCRAMKALRPEIESVDFRLLFVETTAPYAVCVARLDGLLIERGEQRWRDAVRIWSGCQRSGVWPGYAACTLEAPGWISAEAEIGFEEDENVD